MPIAAGEHWLGTVNLPRPGPGWADRSLLAYAGPSEGGGLPPSITMSRDDRRSPADPAGESFEAYVRRQSGLLASSLPGFQVRESLLPRPGMDGMRDLVFSWRAGAASLTQWIVWLPMKDGAVLTYAATSETSKYEDHRPLFEATLARVGIGAESRARET
jgi:hypothetical protein